MRRSENHAAGKLDWPGADLADEIRPIVEPLDRYRRRRLKIREGADQFTVMEQNPLMTVLRLECGPHAIEGAYVLIKVGQGTIAHLPNWPSGIGGKPF
jgi:hypothetical protein